MIDNSGSMRNKLAKVEAAALALVKDSNRDDEVFIVNFNDTAYLDNPKDKDFTNDIGGTAKPRWAGSMPAAAPPCATPSQCPSST